MGECHEVPWMREDYPEGRPIQRESAGPLSCSLAGARFVPRFSIVEQQEEQIDSGWLFRALSRRLLLIAVCALAGFGLALGVSLAQTKEYSAEATLLFRDPSFNQGLFGSGVIPSQDPDREAATNLALVSLDTVAELTARHLGGDFTGADIGQQVTVQSGGQSDLVSVVAEDEDPDTAALIANTFAASYVKFRRAADRSRVRNARELIQANLDRLPPAEQEGSAGKSLQRQLSSLAAFQALQTGNAEVVQQAEVPDSPSSPKTTRNAVLGALLGLLFGGSLALLLERLDRRLREPKEFEAAFGLPMLATIPERRALKDNRMELLLDSDAEALRMLRARLRYFNVDNEIQTVLVTSASPGDGKTTMSWNLAISACRPGSKTLFIEADLRRPAVAGRENLAPIPGLAELLSGQADLDHAMQPVSISIHVDEKGGTGVVAKPAKPGSMMADDVTLDVLVAGAPPPNSGELLESTRMAQLLEDFKKEYDLIIIDTPPVSVISDAIPLFRLVDGAILVARVGSTTRDAAEELRDQLKTLDAPALGVVVNRASSRRHSYYGYGYNYAQQSASARE